MLVERKGSNGKGPMGLVKAERAVGGTKDMAACIWPYRQPPLAALQYTRHGHTG
jgi:hypothetical protein